MNRNKFPHASIVFGFSATGILIIALFLLVIIRMESMHQEVNTIVYQNNMSITLATRMRDSINKRQIILRNMYIYSDYFERDDERMRFYNYAQEFVEIRNSLLKILKDDKELAIYNKIVSASAKAYPLQNELVELAMNNFPINEVEERLKTTFDLQSNVITLLTQLLEYQQVAAQESLAQAGEVYANTRILILSLGAVTAFLVLLIAILVTRRTTIQTRKIRELSKVPLENPSPVMRVKNDGTILFVNEASYCLLEDWNCSLGEKIPQKWHDIIKTMGPNNSKKELLIGCLDKIYSFTIASIENEGYVNFYGKDITESERMKKEIAYQASHDSLTGLHNRREFEKRLKQLLLSAQQEKIEHALLYMDLDQFKVVNDTCGHAAGDRLLKQISSLMLRKIRSSDTLARLGGDEFGIILTSCGQQKASQIANDILQLVKDFHFVWQGNNFQIGVSIGVVSLTPESGSLSELLSAADSACYIAKESGRNRVCSFGAKDLTIKRKHGEMEWVRHINDALKNDSFVLYFQQIIPFIANAPNTIQGEILLRMKNRQGDLISPAAFIKSAERYDLMNNIDRWVINASLRTLGAQHAQCNEDIITCSINLSGQSIGSEGFLDFLVESINTSQVSPKHICFEITETAAIANIDSAIYFIDALREMGCRFALDDFGSGLSSFSYLKNLNVDYLKIDGSFVRDVHTDSVNRSIVEAINRVGHELGMKTVAEFVENKEIADTIIEIGVDYGQGFGLDKPKELDLVIQQLPKRKIAG